MYFICGDRPTNVKAAHDDGNAVVNDWQWSVSGSHITYNPSSNNHSKVTLRPFSNNVTVKIRAKNGCTWSEWANVSPDIIPCGGMFFRIYPNPSDSELFITVNSENRPKSLAEKLEKRALTLELYNLRGNKLKLYKFEKNEIPKIDVTDLKKGIYILRIIGEKVDETHHVLVD